MTKVIADITMSLDGFVTGPDDSIGTLHAWALDSDDPADRDVLRRHVAASGSVVMGRRTFDMVDAPGGWDDEIGYGAREAATHPAFFVVTSSRPASVRLDHDLTFVLDGPAAAIEQAYDAAGDRDVFVMGGAALVRGCLDAGLLDELRIHLSPEVLGDGTPLFDGAGRHLLRQRSVETSPVCTHLVYDVLA